MNFRLRRLLTGSALLGLVTGLGTLLSACQPVPDTIKIGVAQPLTGPLGTLGQDMVDGARMAVEDLNKEGFKVDGKVVKFEIISGDDKSDPETGKKVAQQLIDQGAVAVIGHLNSGVSMAAAPVYAAKMIPQLAISTKPEYTQMGLPTTFRLVASDALQSKAMGAFAAQLPGGTHRYAVVDDATPYGKGLAQSAKAQLTARQREVVLEMSLDAKTTDFAKLIEGLKAQKADVLVTTLADFQVLALADQLAAAGVKLSIVGGDTIKTPAMAKANPAAGKIYATSPIIGVDEFLGGKAFLTRYRAQYKHDPVYGGHYAYDAVYVLAAAIRQAKSVDGEKLVAALKTVDPLAPVTSSMRFADNGEQRYGVVSVYEINNGDWFLLTRSDNW
ncbi:branched-chain amino acid ABC transporter substrate-binding protein [Ideonella dechloratans]|uniref:branched-chain amino acid ABC transporter substrate-binding protein n=1 Tax=Ideonella dechloratans TaxID=36863 RepID=UPI0035AFFC51